MSTTNNGGSAFPAGSVRKHRPAHDPGAEFRVTDRIEPMQPGMTLRDYFAAKAMAALIAEPPWGEGSQTTTTAWGQGFSGPPDESKTAFVAYKVADAMLAAREKGGAA